MKGTKSMNLSSSKFNRLKILPLSLKSFPVFFSLIFQLFCPQNLSAVPAQDIKNMTGGEDVRFVWLEYVRDGKPNWKTKIKVYDTESNQVRQVCPNNDCGEQNYEKPLLTPDGNRIVYTIWDQNKFYITDIDGNNAKYLADGYATCVRTIDNVTWVYAQVGNEGPMWRFNADNASSKELVWDKTGTGDQYQSQSLAVNWCNGTPQRQHASK
jgi:hypothetical protein